MKKFKITISCGAYDAPCLYIEASKNTEAIKEAKSKSGLGRFKNWIFTAKEL